ncbi:MAG: hypothetical protein K8I03_10040, partial [Ignavibacteria bacterium]|nr:hypothetical protein [Ignavibacteria bacterium]
MLKSTALSIIQTFTKEEITKFGDFISSPYFNKKAGVQKLYNEVKKYSPGFTDENLGKEKLWTKLYPGKDYNYGVMKNLIHDFTKLAEEFITQQEYRSRELQQFENLYACLSKRKLHNISENKKAHLIKNYDDKGILKTGMTFDEFYGRLTKIYEIKLWDSTFKDQWENLDGYVTKMEDSFFTGMLIHLVNVNALARVCKQNDKSSENVMLSSDMVLGCFDDKDLLKIIDETGKRSKIKFVLLKSYYLAYKAYSNTDSSSHFYEFKNFVFENFSGMPYNYLKDMDTYLLNSISYLKDKSINKKNEYYEMYQ